MRYVTLTDEQRRGLNYSDKQHISHQIRLVMQAIGKPNTEIEFMTGDLTILCFDRHKLAGFIHILPEANFYEGTIRQAHANEMYVDYIAVAPQYQKQHIATNLYMLSVLELEKQNAESLKAVLVDEYSRRAFEKTAETRQKSLTKVDSCCTETIHIRQ